VSRTSLIAYGTRHDSTHQVAELVGEVLRDDGLEVEVRPASSVTDVEPYEIVVIGGALYMGRWHHDARELLSRHREALAQRPVFAFGMGPLEMTDELIADSRSQLDHALAKVPEVKPIGVAIFGGVVNPEDLPVPLNRMPASNALDPEAVRAWAHDIAAVVRAAPRTA
jgi:menaquinone-dependent protoporphyrinogen IX oxidase